MNRFWNWLLSPFQGYYEYKIRLAEAQDRIDQAARQEKADERKAFLMAIESITQVAVEAAKASQTQAQALNTFLNSFAVTEKPVARHWDEEADNDRYLKEHLPKEMQLMDRVSQYEALLDRMDMGEI